MQHSVTEFADERFVLAIDIHATAPDPTLVSPIFDMLLIVILKTVAGYSLDDKCLVVESCT